MKATIPTENYFVPTSVHDSLKKKLMIGGAMVIDTKEKTVRAKVRFFTPVKTAEGGSVIYCLLEYFGPKEYGGGVARAGGYGYDKKGASFEDAMRKAGITFDESFPSAQEALEAIAVALGSNKKNLMVVHI